MEDTDTLVVRFRPETMQKFAEVVVPRVRSQFPLALTLAAIMTVTITGTYATGVVLAGFRPVSLFLLALLALPGALVWLAVRARRNPPTLDQVALTVTRTHVVFGPRPNLGLLPTGRPGEQWDRTATRVTIAPATSLQPARLQLRNTTTRTRQHQFGVDQLDQPVETIIAAIERR